MSADLDRFQIVLGDIVARRFSGSREESLHVAYELGREALADGVSLLEMAAIEHRILVDVCSKAATVESVAGMLEELGGIFREALMPFEMALRGARETNGALRRQNEVLEEETRRIAHELHDSAGQLLVSAHLTLDRLEGEMAPIARKHLSEVRGILDQAEEKIRHLSHELRPTILDDLGLVPAVRFLGDRIAARTGMLVMVESESMDRLSPAVEVALYRIAQEALTNAAKHSRASRVHVRFRSEVGRVHCDIRDDGVGLDAPWKNATPGSNGLGLVGIRERVTSLGGALRIESHGERGTVLRLAIPLEDIDVPSHSVG